MTDTVKVGLQINLGKDELLYLELDREMPSGVDQVQTDLLIRDLDALASRFGRNDPPTREAIDGYRKRVLSEPAAASPAPVSTPGTTGEYRKDTMPIGAPPPDGKGPVEVPFKIYEKEPGRPSPMPPVKPPAREEKKPAAPLAAATPKEQRTYPPWGHCKVCNEDVNPVQRKTSLTLFDVELCEKHFKERFQQEAEARKK